MKAEDFKLGIDYLLNHPPEKDMIADSVIVKGEKVIIYYKRIKGKRQRHVCIEWRIVNGYYLMKYKRKYGFDLESLKKDKDNENNI